MSCRAGPSLRVLYRVKDDRGVRESLWEAFSKCPCLGMAKGKSRHSGGHSNYKQICQRTQEHHLLISISTGPQARGSPHLISYCKPSPMGVPPGFPASRRAFPLHCCTEASSLDFVKPAPLAAYPSSAPSQKKANRRICSCLPPANLKCSLSSCLLTAPFRKA